MNEQYIRYKQTFPQVDIGLAIYKSSRYQMFHKTGILKNFAKFAGQHLYWSSPFNKVAGLQFVTLL